MIKKIFFIFIILASTTFYNYHAGILDIFKKKTEEQKAAEQAELRKFVDVLNQSVNAPRYQEKFGFIKYLFRRAPQKFFKKYKKEVKNEIDEIAKIIRYERKRATTSEETAFALSEMFLELINLAQGNKQTWDWKKYKKLILKMYKPEIEKAIEFLAKNIKPYDERPYQIRAVESQISNRLTHKRSHKLKKKLLKEIKKKIEIETAIEMFTNIDETSDLRKKMSYIETIINTAPNSFFRKSFWKYSKGLKKKIVNLGELLSARRTASLATASKWAFPEEAYRLSERYLRIIALAQKNTFTESTKKYAKAIEKFYEKDLERAKELRKQNKDRLAREIEDKVIEQVNRILSGNLRIRVSNYLKEIVQNIRRFDL
jgi:hypothetical protein